MTEGVEPDKDTKHEGTQSKAHANGVVESVGSDNLATTTTIAKSSQTDDVDEFGLPIRKVQRRYSYASSKSSKSDEEGEETFEDAVEARPTEPTKAEKPNGVASETHSSEAIQKAEKLPSPEPEASVALGAKGKAAARPVTPEHKDVRTSIKPEIPLKPLPRPREINGAPTSPKNPETHSRSTSLSQKNDKRPKSEQMVIPTEPDSPIPQSGFSEWSHQKVVPQRNKEEADDEKREDEWQEMPSFADYDLYNDDGKLIAREAHESEIEGDAYAALGGAGKGYTKVTMDDDAQSATSMDDDTRYLFKQGGSNALDEEDEDQRDTLTQMQFSKDLLTEGQRIAYVGMVKLATVAMIEDIEKIKESRSIKKELRTTIESQKMWSQKIMVRLYAHMEISPAEQVMIEQLSEHGVLPADLTPTLMKNARVKNPMATESSSSLARPSVDSSRKSIEAPEPQQSVALQNGDIVPEKSASPPPPYEASNEEEELPGVRTPSQMPSSSKIDIDLRWTVLCDLFLVLISDSVYDARSRVLLERVGGYLDVPWLAICKFEKRVTDALEMQEAPDKENWNEDDHKENRRKLALKRRYMMMGLATVGGSLVIGLSAGLLAPVIGAGLAAGFTTIGVAGTSGFLAGAGGAAIITSSSALAGGIIAVRASDRRTGAVKTFEYRPLHNNKRVNLIVTVSGWMTGKVDDVRLPYSTVDPIMGDIYSVLWEPEVLQSLGHTLNIIATEALTQGLQQVLASTILSSLMLALQVPIILSKLSYLIDNPWTVSVGRADAAGLILADSLIERNLGARPITLVGYSLGSRVIFSCLKELAAKGAHGIIQNVYLFGSPIVAKKDEYLRARMIISGRFVSGYARNDWLLGYLFRATGGGIGKVAGLAPVEEIPGLENLEVTELVNGHFAYRQAMPRLLREVGFSVDSDEFAEIEEPDPENHQERQRELIAELDEARKNLAAEPEKKKFGIFSRNKKRAEKQTWETYDESSTKDPTSEAMSSKERTAGSGLLFDVEAIRRELQSEHIEIKELESTMPPVRLSSSNDRPSPEKQKEKSRSPSPAEFELKPRNLDEEYPVSPILRDSRQPTPMMAEFSSAARPALSQHSKSFPGKSFSKDADDETESEGITMSFEPVDRSSAPTLPPYTASEQSQSLGHLPYRTNESPVPNGSTQHLPIANKPSIPPLEHNAWADDEDEFAEKEVSMTFE